MDPAPPQPSAQADQQDQQALLLMLNYVEAECRRLGALEAARHAALAAQALPAAKLASTAQPHAAGAASLH